MDKHLKMESGFVKPSLLR